MFIVIIIRLTFSHLHASSESFLTKLFLELKKTAGLPFGKAGCFLLLTATPLSTQALTSHTTHHTLHRLGVSHREQDSA